MALPISALKAKLNSISTAVGGTGGHWTDLEAAVELLLAASSPAGSTVTQNVAYLGASSSQVIPAGAKGWSYAITSGTATVGGASGIPAGIGDSDQNTLAASFTITTAAASSAYVRWNT